MSDSSSSNDSLEVQEQPAGLSAETILAVRQYNQQIASYTLHQWNIAKLESERKDKERRKRRADYLAQQQREQTQQPPRTANAVPAVRPMGSAGMYGIRPSSEGARPNGDGPLMMVSKRRTDRALSGSGSVPSSGPVQSGIRHSHDQRYASQHSHSYDIHADIASVADQRQQQHPEQQQSRPRRHQRSSVSVLSTLTKDKKLNRAPSPSILYSGFRPNFPARRPNRVLSYFADPRGVDCDRYIRKTENKTYRVDDDRSSFERNRR